MLRNMIIKNLKSRGFTLIEVLIAMVVFLIGSLGIIGMQMFTTTHFREVEKQTKAIYLANFIAERMRNNNSLGSVYASRINPYVGQGNFTQTVNCYDNPCDRQQRVTMDLRDWQQLLDENIGESETPYFPNVAGCIFNTSPNTYQIVIVWRSVNNYGNGPEQAAADCGPDSGYGENGKAKRSVIVNLYMGALT